MTWILDERRREPALNRTSLARKGSDGPAQRIRGLAGRRDRRLEIRTPSLVMAAFRGIGRPLSRLLARAVPDETVRSLAVKAEAMSKQFRRTRRDRQQGRA